MSLQGKVALITGGANGIGKATALRLAHAGMRLAIADIEEDSAASVAAEIAAFHGEAIAIHADLANLRDIDSMIRDTVAAYGRLDVLHNNAYWSADRTAVECSEDEWDHTMNVCLKAPWYASKVAAPYMLKGGGGCIVNTSSVESLVVMPAHCPYATAKAGLNQLTRQMALDLGPLGIRVNAVVPGAIEARGWRNYGPHARDIWKATTPSRRIGEPDDVAGAVLFLIGEDASYVNGECLVVDGGWSPAFRMPPDWMTS